MARRRKRSRKGKMPAGLKAYWAKKRGRTNPPKRRRRKARAVSAAPRRRRRSRAVARVNAPRRHRRRSASRSRSYRRNPGLQTGFIMDAVYVTGGFFATRMVTGYVMPYLPMADQPIVRIAAKGAIAWGMGWAGSRFLGSRQGQLLMLGGLVEALSDAVRTYVSPYVPQLADESMGSYPGLMGSYPGLSGNYSNPYEVGLPAYNEGHDEV